MSWKDWEARPAPGPWFSDDARSYQALRGFAALFFAFAALWALFFWRGPTSESALVLFSLPMAVAGSYLMYQNRKDATDGVDAWRLPVPMNRELFDALEARLGDILRDRGYRLSEQYAPSGLADSATNLPLGRRLDITEVPAPYLDSSERFRTAEGPRIVFFFRLAGKPQIPFFHFRLENVTEANYRGVLRLQKDIVAILEGLDYRSYPDRSLT
jgi:hypothetical protein